MTGTVHEYLCTCMIYSHYWVLKLSVLYQVRADPKETILGVFCEIKKNALCRKTPPPPFLPRPSVYAAFMEFHIGVLYRKLSSKHEFRKNSRCSSHTLLKGVNEFPHFLTSLGEILTVRESTPGWGEIFRTRSHRHWGPPSLLYSAYRVSFSGLKQPGRGFDHTPPSSA